MQYFSRFSEIIITITSNNARWDGPARQVNGPKLNLLLVLLIVVALLIVLLTGTVISVNITTNSNICSTNIKNISTQYY